MANENIRKASEALWKDQSDKNWGAFSGTIKKSNARYYRVFFEKEAKLKKTEDLRKSFAEIYDAKYRPIARVPIFKGKGKNIEGATIYLKGLQVNNRVQA
ncbi:MAG: hypothetical protein KGH52_02645 [Candidatus Micrarchaeota archaeon]|nr:hypothetical protein [Candidatus Micrarchaeota archaeon]